MTMDVRLTHAGALAAALVVLLAGCQNNSTAPSGANLSGTWQTDKYSFSGGGVSASVVVRFVVGPDSAAVTSLELCDAAGSPCSRIVPEEQIGIVSIPIVGGRFEFSHEYPNYTCNGVTEKILFSGVFRSESKADGDFRDTNWDPPGYIFCGTESFTWSATKR